MVYHSLLLENENYLKYVVCRVQDEERRLNKGQCILGKETLPVRGKSNQFYRYLIWNIFNYINLGHEKEPDEGWTELWRTFHSDFVVLPGLRRGRHKPLEDMLKGLKRYRERGKSCPTRSKWTTTALNAFSFVFFLLLKPFTLSVHVLAHEGSWPASQRRYWKTPSCSCCRICLSWKHNQQMSKNMKELRKKGLSLRVKEETRITQALYWSRFREKSLEFVTVNKRC